MTIRFEPPQVSSAQALAWQKLVASRCRLTISALGKQWHFRFVLAASLPQGAIAADIRLGNYSGTIQCGFLPGGRWVQEILRGPGIDSIQEPFRTAVIGVVLQDFLHGLSQSSALPLQLAEPNSSATQSSVPLYWQMLNDQDEAEIVGNLMGGQELISEIFRAASNWPIIPRNLSDDLKISFDVLVDIFSLSRRECALLEVGDILLLGEMAGWRQGNLMIRTKRGMENGSILPIKFPRSDIESTMISKWSPSLASRGVANPSQADAERQLRQLTQLRPKEVNKETGTSQFSHSMPEVQQPDNGGSATEPEWAASEGGEARWMDSVEVVLEFSLGRHTISLGELKRLGQGHIFPIQNLQKPENRLVNILLQGQNIGWGELVQSGEQIGILVRELKEAKSDAQFNRAPAN